MFITTFKLLRKKYDRKYKRDSVIQEAVKLTCPHRHQAASATKEVVVANDNETCPICKQEEHDATVYRWKLIGGLLLPYTLASLDLTIVASSLPFIASYFGTSLIPTSLSRTRTEMLICDNR